MELKWQASFINVQYDTIRYAEISNVRYDMRCHDVTLIQILKQKE